MLFVKCVNHLIEKKTVPVHRIHTLRETILFLFSKTDPVIVVLLICYFVATILFGQTSN